MDANIHKIYFQSIYYALKIDGGRQTGRKTERQKDRKTDRQTKSLIEELRS